MILLVAMSGLPTAQFPNVVPPEIKISATYTGADAVDSLYKAMSRGWISQARTGCPAQIERRSTRFLKLDGQPLSAKSVNHARIEQIFIRRNL